MPRASRLFGVLAWLLGMGCADNPYVIGRVGDAGVAAEACPAGHASARVCSGFERADLSDWSAPMIERSGQIERTSVRTHSGSGALHASSTAMMSVAVLSASFAPALSGALYLRAYLYVPANLPTETMNILFLGNEASGAAFSGIDLNLQDGALQVYSSASDPQRQTGSLAIPRERWFCLRARIALDAADGAVQAYIDAALALDARGVDTLPSGGVQQLHAGIGWSSEQDAFFEIYFDDIVLDSVPVACLS
jgi:hypothetical protein